MNQEPLRPALSRRDFLKLMAATGITAAGGHLLFEVAPWLDYQEQASDVERSFEGNAPLLAQQLELVRYATLAANGHNSQPWKFAITENDIEIHPNYSRRLPVVDPQHRELWISLGCALENLLLASRAAGYVAEVTYPDAADFIHIGLTADIPEKSALFEAIPLRQNTRSEYDGERITTRDLDQVQALRLVPGVVLQIVQNAAERETLLEYVSLANLSQYADTAFLDELIAWLRFNKKEALAARDGLYSRCAGSPDVPRWLGQMFVAGTKPQHQVDADARRLRSSPGAVLIASESDDRRAWVRTGQVYERVALQMTSLGIKSAFLNQPIEVAGLRSEFQTAMGLGRTLPQLLVRFGYANAMPRALRRPIEEVLM